MRPIYKSLDDFSVGSKQSMVGSSRVSPSLVKNQSHWKLPRCSWVAFYDTRVHDDTSCDDRYIDIFAKYRDDFSRKARA